MKAIKACALLLSAVLCTAVMAEETQINVSTGVVESTDELQLPCPFGWSVQANPSADNSLSYLHESGELAVNVTYIADSAGDRVTTQTYARVAAEQLHCQMPVASDVIDNAWSFFCEDEDIEAVVYGAEGDLVLLSVSGRNEETERYLSEFIRFLAYQAGR